MLLRGLHTYGQSLEPLDPEHIYDVTQSLSDAPAKTISCSTLNEDYVRFYRLQIA